MDGRRRRPGFQGGEVGPQPAWEGGTVSSGMSSTVRVSLNSGKEAPRLWETEQNTELGQWREEGVSEDPKDGHPHFHSFALPQEKEPRRAILSEAGKKKKSLLLFHTKVKTLMSLLVLRRSGGLSVRKTEDKERR